MLEFRGMFAPSRHDTTYFYHRGIDRTATPIFLSPKHVHVCGSNEAKSLEMVTIIKCREVVNLLHKIPASFITVAYNGTVGVRA